MLLHGYAQNSHMWRPLIAELAKTHLVIAPDLRGFGASDKPEGGYDKKTMAADIHALAAIARPKDVGIAGHDIGLMVAYAYAAQYPAEVEPHRADGCLPARRRRLDEGLAAARPLALPFLRQDAAGAGRGPRAHLFRAFLERFRRRPGAFRLRGRPRSSTAKAYAQPGAMRAGFEVFRAFEQDAKDFAGFAKTKLTMPMLVLSGEKAGGQFLIDQGRLVDDNVEGVIIKGSGHWLIDEAPDQVIPSWSRSFRTEAGRRLGAGHGLPLPLSGLPTPRPRARA